MGERETSRIERWSRHARNYRSSLKLTDNLIPITGELIPPVANAPESVQSSLNRLFILEEELKGGRSREDAPCLLKDNPSFLSTRITQWEAHVHALDPSSDLAKYQADLFQTRTAIQSILDPARDQPVKDLANKLLEIIDDSLSMIKTKAVTERERLRMLSSIHSETRVIAAKRFHTKSATIWTTQPKETLNYLSIASIHLLAYLSAAKTRLVNGMLNSDNSKAYSRFPQKVSTVIEALGILPEIHNFGCCPSCFYMYPFGPSGRLDDFQGDPKLCSKPSPLTGRPCGAKLGEWTKATNGTDSAWHPTRHVAVQDVEAWLARLHCREDLQPYLHRPRKTNRVGSLSDILDSHIFDHIIGPDGQPFLQLKVGECRLVLAFNEDGVNLGDNKAAGKIRKVSAFYLTCLQLPATIRLQQENMCLLLVCPGEPTKYFINSILEILVKMLLHLWFHGVYVDDDVLHKLGCLIRAAVIPILADLPALRLLTGYLSFNHTHFCTFCLQTIHDIDDLDFDNWEPRDFDEDRRNARRWRDATSKKDKVAIEDEFGVRWSALFDLPYYLGSHHMAIDADMHAFCLRIIPTHLREVMGISNSPKLKEGEPFANTNLKGVASSDKAAAYRKIIDPSRPHTKSAIRLFPVPVLRALCMEAGLQWGGVHGKQRMIRALQTKFFPNLPVHEVQLDDQNTRPQSADDVNMLIAEELYTTRSKSFLRKLRLPVVRRIIQLCMPEALRPSATASADDVHDAIEQHRMSLGIVNPKGRINRPRAVRLEHLDQQSELPAASVIFGQNMLDRMAEVHKNINYPSGTQPPPSNFAGGKQRLVSAAEWRTLFMVVIPMTVLPLWGILSSESLEYRRLQNYMHLLAAYRFSRASVITPTIRKGYQTHYRRYLVTLLELYPGTYIRPYHHILAHYHTELERFGPKDGHNLWQYEQKNGTLRKIHTNFHEEGDMELTKLMKYSAAGNLRALIKGASEEFTKALPDFVKLYTANYEFSLLSKLKKNSHLVYTTDLEVDVAASLRLVKGMQPVLADEETYLLVSDFLEQRGYRVKGQIFVFPQRSLTTPIGFHCAMEQNQAMHSEWRAENIIIYSSSGHGFERKGLITRIFSYIFQTIDGDQLYTFLSVRPYRELQDREKKHDFCTGFPDAGFTVTYDQFEREELIELASVTAQPICSKVDIQGIPQPCILFADVL